jgi:hypothetical protein
VVLKNKYLIIKFMCGIAAIMLGISHFVGNVNTRNLTPFVVIILFILQIVEVNKSPELYTKRNGLKIFISGMLFFWIFLAIFALFHT